MTTTEANPYPQIKAYERAEFDRLGKYLAALDAGGWVEQSYCTDWRVYQVVSHIGSGSQIGGLRLRAWVDGGPPVTREMMQAIWGHFDSLAPEQMLSAYREAVDEYLATEAATPDEAGQQEVDGFAGRRPLAAYQVSRVWELACHSWDVYVSRDRTARLQPEAVVILAANLHQMFVPIDRDRAKALATSPIAFKLTDSGGTYTLDPSADRPRVQPATDVADAPLARPRRGGALLRSRALHGVERLPIGVVAQSGRVRERYQRTLRRCLWHAAVRLDIVAQPFVMDKTIECDVQNF